MTTFKQVKRIVIAVIGGTVLLLGLALIVLPGPAFIVIPIGLGILATEFAWARRWMKKVKDLIPRNHSTSAAKENPAPQDAAAKR